MISERERVLAALTELSLPAVPSEANFLWLDLPGDAKALGEFSERRGVVLRVFPGVGVRVSVGTSAENDRMTEVLRGAIAAGVVTPPRTR